MEREWRKKRKRRKGGEKETERGRKSGEGGGREDETERERNLCIHLSLPPDLHQQQAYHYSLSLPFYFHYSLFVSFFQHHDDPQRFYFALAKRHISPRVCQPFSKMNFRCRRGITRKKKKGTGLFFRNMRRESLFFFFLDVASLMAASCWL